MQPSIRHMRMFQTLAETHSVTRTAEICHVSQPAVTQAMNKLERDANQPLFQRTPQGIFPNEAGQAMVRRTRRALALLDAAMADMARAIRFQATRPQLHALIAVTETENFTLAARQLGLAQPTVHRSTSMLEQASGVQFFERTAHGLIATKAARQLAQAARLAFAEMDQADSDLAALAGEEGGRIVIGALPLSRSTILPEAMLRFRADHPGVAFDIVDGRYDELLAGLRRGSIDFVIGALRVPSPNDDVQQERMFDDSVVIVAGRGHPLLQRDAVSQEDLQSYPWVVARKGTPIRAALETMLPDECIRGAIVTSSVIMLREILGSSDCLGALSTVQVRTQAETAALGIIPVDIPDSYRPIGITTRTGWEPTAMQQEFLDLLREGAAKIKRPRLAVG